MISGNRITITLAAATLAFFSLPRVRAAGIVTPSVLDSREWSFTLTGVPNANPWWSIQFGDDRLDPGDWLGVYFYSGAVTGDPVWEYVRQNTLDFSLDGVLKADLTGQGFFQEGSGTVRFELYAGGVEIQRVHLFTEFGGLSYTASMMEPFTLVPEPRTATLVFGMFFGIAVRRVRRVRRRPST